jgi:hypothetical protein
LIILNQGDSPHIGNFGRRSLPEFPRAFPERRIPLGTLEVLIDELKEYKKLKLISEMVPVKERIKLLENKYDCNFKNFEKKIINQPENLKLWDDYIEWKAYQKKFDEIKEKIGEIKNAKDITITK